MVIKRYFILFSILSLLTNLANAQEVTTITGTNLKDTVQSNAADTIPMIEIEDLDLDNIISLRAQFEKQNQSYSAPVTPNENLLRFLKKTKWNCRTKPCTGHVWCAMLPLSSTRI